MKLPGISKFISPHEKGISKTVGETAFFNGKGNGGKIMLGAALW